MAGPEADPSHVEHLLAGTHDVQRHFPRSHRPGHYGLAHQLEARGDPGVELRFGSGRALFGLRFEVEEHREELGTRHPVDRRVVHFGDQPDAVRRPRPRRSTSPTGACSDRADGRRCPRPDRPAGASRQDVGPRPASRGSRCRSRHRRPRPGGPSRNGTSTSRRRKTGASGMRVSIEPFIRSNEIAPRNRRRIEDQGQGHVHVEGRGLQIEKAGVEPAQSLHPRSLPRIPYLDHPLDPPGPSRRRSPIGFTSPAGACCIEGWPGCSSQSAWSSRCSWSTPIFPVRREPFTVASFALGWIPGELPLHVGALEVAVTVVFATDGVFRTWPGWLGLAVAVASWAGMVRLAVVCHRARALVDEALDGATGGPIGVDGFDPLPAWNQAGGAWSSPSPSDCGASGGSRNIDYWGDGNYRHKLDILSRRSVKPAQAPVLVYIHGGAWMIGDKTAAGYPDDARAGPTRLGLCLHQLPIEPESDLAGRTSSTASGPWPGCGTTSPSTEAIPGSSPSRAGRPAATWPRSWP